MEFLQLMESLQADAADPKKLFSDAGVRVRGRDPRKLLEAAKLIEAAAKSRRGMFLLEEAMTTSDFPLLFGDIIDRQLLGRYAEFMPSYTNYCRIGKVPDFRTVKRLATDGAEGVLGQVPQRGDYPQAKMSDKAYTYAVNKYGRVVPFDWETMINDDLGGLDGVPARLARAARRSEEKFATTLFVDANGPHASLYTTGNKNKVSTANGATSTNPALSAQALQDAMTVIKSQVDADGEPITIDMVELVVPPALEITATNLMHALQILAGGFGQATTGTSGGNQSQTLVAENWMKMKFRVNVNSYIPLVANAANGNTSWFLFARPSEGRPALEVGFLRGHEAPEMFMKSPNAMRIGSGAQDPMDGDFDTDTIQYKIRHVFGGTRLEPKATVASNGSGS